jgi:peptidyl-prolyl cis-trans isomerase SurA
MSPQTKNLVRRLLRTLLVVAVLAGAVAVGFAAMLWLANKAQADPIDKIAAIVEDQVILKSEVDEQLAIYASQANISETDSTAMHDLREHILDRMIDEKVVLAEAKKQGITIAESDLEQAVNDAIDDTKKRIGSEAQFNLELEKEGLSLNDLRERYRDEVQKQMLENRLVGKEIRSKVQVDSADVDAYYAEHKDELPKKPEQVHLRHILIKPQADPAAEKAAFDKAKAVRARIVAGEDFAKVAAEVSDDVSAKAGGDIGRIKRGDLEAPLDSVAFAIDVGTLSQPVRTARGWDLIRVDQRQEDEARVRHILIKVPISQEQKDAASTLAENIHERALNGESFADLARRYTDEDQVRESGGDLGNLPVQALREPYLSAIQGLEPGGISKVVSDDKGYHLFQLVERVPEQDYTLDEIRQDLQQYAYQEKLESAYENWVAGLRKNYFIEKRES